MNLLTITDKFLKDREHQSNDTFGMEIRRLCKEKASTNPESLYQKFLEVYDKFLQNKIGVGAKIDGRQGQALKTIIAYISKESKVKTDDGILISWSYLLENWNRLPDYYRNRMTLSDINSNLINIITNLRNGNGSSKDIEQQIAEKIG